jgi:hypothetical protein
MKTALIGVAAMIALSPGVARPAQANAVQPDLNGRRIFAERKFGEVRFVIGAGAAMKWLEMYADGNLIAAFRDFAADDVVAAPDGQHFLAFSNTADSSLAFAILDRSGHVVDSSVHDGSLHYCSRTTGRSSEWINAAKPQAKFWTTQTEPSSAPYLQITVRGCDGNTVALTHRLPPPAKQQPALPDSASEVVPTGTRIASRAKSADMDNLDRSSSFIGNTIAELLRRDPNAGDRTLILTDSRRSTSATPPSTR